MGKYFLIRQWFEKEIRAESEEKALKIFYTEFNNTNLADFNLKVNYRDKNKSEQRIQYENDLSDMIEYYKEEGYFHEVKNERKNIIQMFDEKIEIMICGKCMQKGIFYLDNSGKVACKHYWEDLLEKYQEMKEEGTL